MPSLVRREKSFSFSRQHSENICVEGFNGVKWREEINVRDFIQCNYTPYDGDESFLEKPTSSTDKLWEKLQQRRKPLGCGSCGIP